MQGQVLNTEDLEVVCDPTADDGSPALLEANSFTVTSDNPAVISDGVLTQDGGADPAKPEYIARCTVSGNVGDKAILTVSGDGDVGSGVATLTDTIEVTIVHANAKNLGLAIRGVPKAS